MNIWAIIGLIYAGLTVIMMTSFVVEHFFEKKHLDLKPWSFRKQPALWVKLAVSPLVAWLFVFSIKKLYQILYYGLHGDGNNITSYIHELLISNRGEFILEKDDIWYLVKSNGELEPVIKAKPSEVTNKLRLKY